MCGRFNLVDSAAVQMICAIAGVDLGKHHLRYYNDIPPGATISIIRQIGDERVISDAIWWLILDRETGKPSKYTSFNSRSDKLHETRAFAYKPYRESRCIIPATAFIEGLGDSKTYHKIELEGQAISFGGIYKEYLIEATGEVVIGASIITLGGLPEWKDIHPDSMPLILPQDEDLFNAWLDPTITDVAQFDWLLEPAIRTTQKVTKIGRPSKWNPVEDAFNIIQWSQERL